MSNRETRRLDLKATDLRARVLESERRVIGLCRDSTEREKRVSHAKRTFWQVQKAIVDQGRKEVRPQVAAQLLHEGDKKLRRVKEVLVHGKAQLQEVKAKLCGEVQNLTLQRTRLDAAHQSKHVLTLKTIERERLRESDEVQEMHAARSGYSGALELAGPTLGMQAVAPQPTDQGPQQRHERSDCPQPQREGPDPKAEKRAPVVGAPEYSVRYTDASGRKVSVSVSEGVFGEALFRLGASDRSVVKELERERDPIRERLRRQGTKIGAIDIVEEELT